MIRFLPLVFHLITDLKGNVQIRGSGEICTLVKLRLYLYNLGHIAVLFCGGSQMEKASTNAEQQHESKVNEAENFDTFIKAMVQVVEKYGRFVLQELDCVA